ncbi:MAG: hypothetical protein DWQ07_01910 [Chloroflexi bacterium]|nr:MAG: hypothetical protein DWQ07_01910 [Chloroflexota bacterium]MBL1193746.1 hypothetical protein [Chloroflexota bacterium]NOH11039.1 hypothetical protein [Chloroflexota bacterium]
MSEKIDWTHERLQKEFSKLPNGAGENLQKILDWAISNDRFQKSRAKSAAFGIAGRKRGRVFSIYSNGEMRVFLNVEKYPEGPEERDDMLRWLRSINIVDVKPKLEDSKRSILGSRKVTQLNSQELIFLFGIFNQACFGWDIREQKVFPWTPKNLTKFFTDMSSHKTKNQKWEIQKRILDWAVANKRFDQSYSFRPAFGVVGNTGKRIFIFHGVGYILITVNKDYYPGGTSQRDNIVTRLKEINLLKDDYNPEKAKIDWKIASKLSGQLSDSEVDTLLKILEEFCL